MCVCVCVCNKTVRACFSAWRRISIEIEEFRRSREPASDNEESNKVDYLEGKFQQWLVIVQETQ
jgi:hypothetical protein